MTAFLKMHGLGNDFIVLDGRARMPALTPQTVRRLADRHTGIGCDQLIVIEPPRGRDGDAFMRILNSDGGEVEACGNAVRCIGALVMGERGRETALVETLAGPVSVSADGRGINKHHEIWYHFGRVGQAAEGREYGALADKQPIALATGKWNVGTEVFGPLAARPNDSPYEAIVDRIFELERKAQDDFGDYGWYLFGAGPHYSYQWDRETKRHYADPRRFECPAEFKIDRENISAHMAFGRGVHSCPGGPLARAEGRISLEHILRRIKNIRLDPEFHGDAGSETFQYERTWVLRGLRKINILFDKA